VRPLDSVCAQPAFRASSADITAFPAQESLTSTSPPPLHSFYKHIGKETDSDMASQGYYNQGPPQGYGYGGPQPPQQA